MSNDATVDITAVEPEAVVITAKDLKVGDTVFDVYGGKHEVTGVHTTLHWIYFARDDGYRGVFPLEDEVTVIRGPIVTDQREV